MLTRELIANVRQIEIRTRRIVDHLTAGAYHSVFKGRGIEFDEVREYFPGDDVRAIDWNVTARFGHPYIKKFVEERELTVFLMVDISGSGDFGTRNKTKNQVAAELSALLAFSAIRNNDQVGLMLFTSRQELFVPPRKGRRHVLRLIRELLACERQSSQTDIRNALENMMKLTSRRAVVFLISDMLDSGYARTLSAANQRHDVVALRLTDPADLRLPKVGWANVADAESATCMSLNTSRRNNRTRYGLEAANLRQEQDVICRKAGVDLIDINCGDDLVMPLLRFFKLREKRRRHG
ncbi:MAG: DUF58 domain-containing protein [Lentisphaeria bacterium]